MHYYNYDVLLFTGIRTVINRVLVIARRQGCNCTSWGQGSKTYPVDILELSGKC